MLPVFLSGQIMLSPQPLDLHPLLLALLDA
jgi:hypothetical protein